MSLGPAEILIVLLVALLVLGPDQLPRAARQLAKGIREVKKFSAGVQAQVNDALEIEDEKDRASQGPPIPPGPSGNPPNPDTEGFKFIDTPSGAPDPPVPNPSVPPNPQPDDNGHDPKPAE